MSIYSFKLNEIPDLSLNKYQSLSSSGISGVLERHRAFLRQWYGLCKESQSSLHLLYCFNPEDSAGQRLSVYFLLQGDDDRIKSMIPMLNQSLLSDFYHFEPCDLPEIYFDAGATLIKKEREAFITSSSSYAQKEIHYVPKWEVNHHSRLYNLFTMMKTASMAYQQKPCAYRIDIYPSSLSSQTRDILTPVIKELQGDHDIQLLNNHYHSSDDYSNYVKRECEDWLSKVESSPVFRVNMYGFAQNDFLAKALLNTAASEAIEKGDFTIAPIRNDVDGYCSLLSRLSSKPNDYCSSSIAKLKSWATTYTLEEVEPFFRLPVLYDGENIDIPKETKPKYEKNGINLGEDEHGHAVYFPTNDLTRHAFFTGMPGSGKTNTMLHLISELKKKNIPFLVLEPAKKEYREMLLKKEMKDVYLFSPRLASSFPLRMNPMAFPKGVSLNDHINALLEVFKGSFILEGPTYKFLSGAIVRSYTNLGWDIEDINHGDFEYPTLNDVYHIIEDEINATTYTEDYKGNVRSFLQVRLGSLMERDAGELFNTSVSTLNPEDWITRSAIVELEVLNEQAKNFFVLLICHYILETLRAHPLTDPSVDVRHALFIEEAHNIIASSSMQTSSDSIDPKVSATEYLTKMLAEVRALKEAMIIADQLPTALAIEVTKNTGLKLVHRLTAQDDRELIGSTISASPLQNEQMATLSKGKTLIYHEKTQKPYLVQIHQWQKLKSKIDFSNDHELYHSMIKRDVIPIAILSALDSFNEKYIQTLKDDVMNLLEDYNHIDFGNELAVKELELKKLIVTEQGNKILRKLEKLYQLWMIDLMDNRDIESYYSECYLNTNTLLSFLDVIILD